MERKHGLPRNDCQRRSGKGRNIHFNVWRHDPAVAGAVQCRLLISSLLFRAATLHSKAPWVAPAAVAAPRGDVYLLILHVSAPPHQPPTHPGRLQTTIFPCVSVSALLACFTFYPPS